jgi:aryl-alcohol dehydrogenase-like predicted oxidoreductase
MIGDDVASQRKLVQRILDSGINWIDTAASYGEGRAESALGTALATLDAVSQVEIATKVRLLAADLGDIEGAIRRSVTASLGRLRVRQVALLQLHNAITAEREQEPTSLTPRDVLGPGGVIHSFSKLRSEGVMKACGITAIGQAAPLREVVTSAQFDTIQVPYNLVNPTAGHDVPATFPEANYGNIIDCAAQLSMGIFAIRVYAGGVLAGNSPSQHALTTKFFPAALFERDQERVAKLRELLPNEDIKQSALRFALSHSAVSSAIVGFSEPSHVDDALQAIDPLPSEMLEKIQQFSYL